MNLVETFFNWAVFRDALPMLLEGLWVTVLLGVVSILAGFLTGLLMALVRLYGSAWSRTLARVFDGAESGG